MRLTILGLSLSLLPYLVYGAVDFKNDREGESFYNSGSDARSINRAVEQMGSQWIPYAFNEIARNQDPAKVCAFDITTALSKRLKLENPRFDEMRGAILHLRKEDEFDDVVAKILLTAHDAQTRTVEPKQELSRPVKAKEIQDAFKIIAGFEKKAKGQCFDDAYKSFFGDVLRINKDWKTHHVEALLVMALEKKQITSTVYLSLERARLAELHQSQLNLKTYLKKIQSLRTQFPLRDANEKSDFVTRKADKLKRSYRQRLLESYSDIQILIMADIMKKLRRRLESPKAEILIYDRNQGVETIELEPMERFRLAIKLLQKEMAQLALNTYFNGNSPGYMDMMAASYEIGIIPAVELQEVAGLEEIWNPKKTFWEKADMWIRTFSTVATIALPPPYGFVPALAVVIIEMTVGKTKDQTEDNTVLF